MQRLQNVTTNTYPGNTTQTWKESFNQALFINYDPINSLWVNQIEIKPGVTNAASGAVYPTTFVIALNAGEVNDTRFILDIKGSSTAGYNIVYTLYIDQ